MLTLCLALALAAMGTSMFLRIRDSQKPPQPDNHSLSEQAIGVFDDGLSAASLSVVPEASAITYGAELPEERWDLDIQPGPISKGRLSLIRLTAPSVWHLDIRYPILMSFQLPHGASLAEHTDRAVAESAGTCASWWDGKQWQHAKPVLHASELGDVVVTCSIPALGQISSLFFDLQFQWKDQLTSSAGFGRTNSWIRLSSSEPSSADISIPLRDRESFRVMRPLKLTVSLDSGTRILDSFPAPGGGGLGSRVWAIDEGSDIEYQTETYAERALIQPAMDLTLLLAGLFFGLVPGAWGLGSMLSSGTRRVR